MRGRADLGGWLCLVSFGFLGLLYIVDGELSLPTTSGYIALDGWPARVFGIGLVGLAASFYGVVHHTENASVLMFDRFVCVYGGRTLFFSCWLYLLILRIM